MKTELFQHEITNTSAVFGRKAEVRVVFEGEQAMTDNNTIVLPSLPQGAEIDEKSEGIFRGFTDHEAGHVRHTDRKVLEGAKGLFKANPGLQMVWNSLEDVWLEKRVIDEYPGAKKNLRITAEAIDERALKDIPEGDERWKDDKFIGGIAITWEGRKGYGHKTGEQCLDRVSPELREVLPSWVKAVDLCENTQDVLNLAKIIHGQLKEEEYEDPSEELRKAKGEGEGKPGKNPSRRLGSTDTTDEAGEDYKDDYKVYEGPKLEDLVKETAQRLSASKKGAEMYLPYSTQYDKWHHVKDADNKYGHYTYGKAMRHMAQSHPNKYQHRIERASGHINVVRRKLERALMSKLNRGWETGHEFGKLDNKRLVQAWRAEPKVYKRREPVSELDTAVSFLIDLSGSMCGGKADLATDVVVVLAEVMAKVGIPFEIIGFNSKSNYHTGAGGGWQSAYSEHGNKYARYECCDMYLFKSWDDRFHEAKKVIAHIDQHAGGNNIDGESVLYAFSRLKVRKEKRKVLMVLSDGSPAWSGIRANGVTHTRQSVKTVESQGVTCVGIGIMDDSVRKFYPRNVVVNELADLGLNAVDQLARVLLGERYVVDNATLMKGAAA